MRRTVVTLAVVGLFAACGFPDVTYENGGDDGGADSKTGTDGPISGEGSSGGETSTADGAIEGGDSSTSAETGTDAPADGPGDSSAVDSPVDAVDEQPADSGADAPGDAPADVHDTGVDAPVCDFDQDTYKAEGTTCGGTDCCDTDNKAHPGQTTYYTTADACGSFDYNCSGASDPEYPANLKCGGTGITGCTGGSGFISTDPGCGNSGLYGTCVPNGALACQAGNEITVTQGCH